MANVITIVHAADLHIDSPLRGLDRIGSGQLARTLRQATRGAFENLIDLVIERQADALVLAGDIYDGNAKDFGTARFFGEQMNRLDRAGIAVVMVTGNHDADSVITRSLQLPDNVHVLPTDRPGTVQIPGAAFHGQGFATKAVLTNLAISYPDPIPGVVNVGILHTSVAGYEGHDSYAPCSVADLQSKGYEYFALGHVHQRQVLCEGRTTAAFSGNLQGRHIKETGPKGAFVVTLTPGRPAELEFAALDVARWAHLTVELDTASTLAEALDLVAQQMAAARQEAANLPLVARITLIGATPAASDLADAEQLRAEVALVADRLDVVVERVRNRTELPAQSERPGVDPSVLRDLAERISEADINKLLVKLRTETDLVLRDHQLTESLDAKGVRDEALQALTARLAGGK